MVELTLNLASIQASFIFIMIQPIHTQFETVRTTVNLPVALLNRSQTLVEQGLIPNRNSLIIIAMEQYIVELENKVIDTQILKMADDPAYLALNEQIATEFEESDWEALTYEPEVGNETW